ncbi:MAG: glycerol-3-phosphate dehydrogenase/oxidase [Actinobacteria bacterium]|nr:glycerol-3-phosphate dehydrogenase/oxidase [Actinomycetota bacterium]
MKRDLSRFPGKNYDVIIIGGGIYGACTAWYAAQQNLSVLLLEKEDFGHATSFNSQKIVHGGLRYLQHMDFQRIFESVRETSLLRRIAPNLIYPMPCVMPAYRYLLQGKEILWVAVNLYKLISLNRSRSLEAQNHVPGGRIISREECLKFFPALPTEGLRGGALWYDAQVYNTERLLLSFIKSAVGFGADIANYAEVVGFVFDGDRVVGVEVKDILSDQKFTVNGRITANASGPWVNKVLSLIRRSHGTPEVHFIKVNLLVTRPFIDGCSLGVSSRKKYVDSDAFIKKGARLLFFTPWHGYNLVGTTEQHYSGSPDDCRMSEKEIDNLINDINDAYPAACLGRKDVLFFYTGLLPGSIKGIDSGQTHILKKYSIIDHARIDAVEGLVSVIGVKFTTATDVARKTVGMILGKLGRRRILKVDPDVSLWNSNATKASFDDYLKGALKDSRGNLDSEVIRHLVVNYGTQYKEILRYTEEDVSLLGRVVSSSPVIWAELAYAIREEMAERLSDLMLRRTELGEAGYPGEKCLRDCADFMAREKGWDEARIKKEISEVKAIYQPLA